MLISISVLGVPAEPCPGQQNPRLDHLHKDLELPTGLGSGDLELIAGTSSWFWISTLNHVLVFQNTLLEPVPRFHSSTGPNPAIRSPPLAWSSPLDHVQMIQNSLLKQVLGARSLLDRPGFTTLQNFNEKFSELPNVFNWITIITVTTQDLNDLCLKNPLA